MKRSLILLLAYFFNLVFFQKAEASVQLNSTIEFATNRKNANINIDNLGNIYVFNEKVIDKYNSLGKLLYTYSVTNATNISRIDVLNPLRILVFYKDVNQVSFLDNTLSETGISINLNSIDLQLTTMVCNSSSKGFWVFDSQNIEILHLSSNLEIISRTGNLAILLQSEIQPSNMYEFNNQLYLTNPKSILVFDIFGTFIKEIPFECSSCFVTENAIFSCNKNLMEYDFKTRQIEELKNFDGFINPESKCISNGTYLYIIDKFGLVKLYKIRP
jgi:hypothetical protein